MILKATHYVSLSLSIYYHIRLHPRQIDHNPMHHYWNNYVAEAGDCVVVICGDKVVINSIHHKNNNSNNNRYFHL